MALFSFSDAFNYSNGNLSGNGPWAFAFPGGGCATLGCAVNTNRVRLDSDTVGGHWTVTRVTTAPFTKRWRIQCTFKGFVTTNKGRWGFGIATATDDSPYTLDRAFGFGVLRNIDAGGVTNNSREVGPNGVCGVAESVFTDGTIATDDVLKLISRPSGGDNYEIDYYKNGTLLNTRTHVAAVGNVGGQPCFIHPSNGGTQGISEWDDIVIQELAVPTFTAISPNSVSRGANHTVGLTGTGFTEPQQVTISGAGVTVNSVVVNSETSASVNITVDPGAALGPRTVTVINDGGTSGTQNLEITEVAAGEGGSFVGGGLATGGFRTRKRERLWWAFRKENLCRNNANKQLVPALAILI